MYIFTIAFHRAWPTMLKMNRRTTMKNDERRQEDLYTIVCRTIVQSAVKENSIQNYNNSSNNKNNGRKKKKKITKQFCIYSITNIEKTTWRVIRVCIHKHQYNFYELIFIEKNCEKKKRKEIGFLKEEKKHSSVTTMSFLLCTSLQ